MCEHGCKSLTSAMEFTEHEMGYVIVDNVNNKCNIWREAISSTY